MSIVDAGDGEVALVEGVFLFGHVGCVVDEGEELVGEVAAGEAEVGAGVARCDEVFELMKGEEVVVDGVVDFVGDDEVEVAGLGERKCICICGGGGGAVLGGGDPCFCRFFREVKTFAAFVHMHFAGVEAGKFCEGLVFGDDLELDELDESDREAGAEGAECEAEGGFGFALPFSGEDDYA